jgi:hypothetical protein
MHGPQSSAAKIIGRREIDAISGKLVPDQDHADAPSRFMIVVNSK